MNREAAVETVNVGSVSDRVKLNRADATETVNLSSALSRVKLKTIKIGIFSFPPRR